jgi:hypothetical protein
MLDVIHPHTQNQLYKHFLTKDLQKLSHAKPEHDFGNHIHSDLDALNKHLQSNSSRNQIHAIKNSSSEVIISQILQSRQLMK